MPGVAELAIYAPSCGLPCRTFDGRNRASGFSHTCFSEPSSSVARSATALRREMQRGAGAQVTALHGVDRRRIADKGGPITEGEGDPRMADLGIKDGPARLNGICRSGKHRAGIALVIAARSNHGQAHVRVQMGLALTETYPKRNHRVGLCPFSHPHDVPPLDPVPDDRGPLLSPG